MRDAVDIPIWLEPDRLTPYQDRVRRDPMSPERFWVWPSREPMMTAACEPSRRIKARSVHCRGGAAVGGLARACLGADAFGAAGAADSAGRGCLSRRGARGGSIFAGR